MSPVTLKSTYARWNPDFKFTHIAGSVLDQTLWSLEDPRQISGSNTSFCNDCGYFQSNNISSNECRCFPELYGACRAPVPVQVFRNPLEKNNGLTARYVRLIQAPHVPETRFNSSLPGVPSWIRNRRIHRPDHQEHGRNRCDAKWS